MQGCQLVESHKSAGSPERSPETVPAREQTRKQTKNKQGKNRKNTTKTKTKQKRQKRSGIATSNENYMHDDILCVILRMTHNKKQNRTNTKHTNGPHSWVREATKLHAETRDPPSQDPRDHKEQPFRNDITSRHFEANTDNAGSQREW